jgi:hypothetical protein
MTRRSIVFVGLLIVLAGASALRSVGGSAGPMGGRAAGARAATLAAPGDRAHPHGPEADEIVRTPGRLAWSTNAGPLWSGAGRHPIWRGCQHRYDPELSAFVFGPTSSPG